MSEIALTHQASPGAAASGQVYLFFNLDGRACQVGSDGLVRPIVPVVAALTDADSIEVDARYAHRIKFNLVLEGNRFLANPTHLVDGARLSVVIRQDSGGSRTLAYGNKYRFPGGTAPVLTTTPGRVDVLEALYDAAGDALLCSFVADIR